MRGQLGTPCPPQCSAAHARTRTHFVELPGSAPSLDVRRGEAHDVAQEAVAGVVKDAHARDVQARAADAAQACSESRPLLSVSWRP